MTFKPKTFIFALGCLPFSIQAGDTFSYDGDVNVIVQTSDYAQAETGTETSADLFLHYTKQAWQFNLHLEGNITPSSNSITALLPKANADAFSAVDEYDHGRIQVSELYVDYVSNQNKLRQLSIGLLDATAFFDTNAIMNDENTQFIASTLGNNPTIDFPDYTLGLTGIFQAGVTANAQTRVGLFSGKGLADNANRAYNEAIELNPDSKGAFMIAESQLMETPIHHLSAGVWLHNGDHTHIKKPNKTRLINYGAYLTGSHQMGANTMGLRIGYSRPEVNELNKMLSLGIEHQYSAQWVTAAAASFQFASSEATQIDNPQTYEVYARYQPAKPEFYVTPSIQYFKNTTLGKDIWLGNLRLSYIF
jgi:hypothetical protein